MQIVLRLRFDRFPDMRSVYWIKESVSAAVEVKFKKEYHQWEALIFKGLIINFAFDGSSNMRVITDSEVVGTMLGASLVEKNGEQCVHRIPCYERVRITHKPQST